jgi:hypothetical protein
MSNLARYFAPDQQTRKHLLSVGPRVSFEIAAQSKFDAAQGLLPKPDELEWWDWTLLLLKAAAEIEHSLMVQYLYAALSIGEPPFRGSSVPPNAATIAAGWRRQLLLIAREEMAHLLTVQNFFQILGIDPSLERQAFPAPSFYPFPFQLEPVSRHSLAKYVVAEMPASEATKIPEIIAEANTAAGSNVNLVGPIYHTLSEIMKDSTRLTDADLDFSGAYTRQATADDWFANDADLIVRNPKSRDEVYQALREIGEQGEGPWEQARDSIPSHYSRFLSIYNAFPSQKAGAPADWTPTKAVPTNPNTSGAGAGAITNESALLWSRLSNIRYRMLLTLIQHALTLEGPKSKDDTITPKGYLIDWAFEEMVGRKLAGLARLDRVISSFPQGNDPNIKAASPFELPYSLFVPTNPHSRWKLQNQLIGASIGLRSQIKAVSGNHAILDEYDLIDADRLAIIQRINE